MVEHHEVNANSDSNKAITAPPKKSSRRPDIDVIRIVLTWGILVYHTALIYGPYLIYYVRIIPDSGVDNWTVIYIYFVTSMNAWNMPMFFFLSGIRKGNILVQQEHFLQKFFQCIFWAEEEVRETV